MAIPVLTSTAEHNNNHGGQQRLKGVLRWEQLCLHVIILFKIEQEEPLHL